MKYTPRVPGVTTKGLLKTRTRIHFKTIFYKENICNVWIQEHLNKKLFVSKKYIFTIFNDTVCPRSFDSIFIVSNLDILYANPEWKVNLTLYTRRTVRDLTHILNRLLWVPKWANPLPPPRPLNSSFGQLISEMISKLYVKAKLYSNFSIIFNE